jgi:SRSO17 transposase
MDAQQIRKLRPMLSKFLAKFDDCFSRIEPADNLSVYVSGQLSDLLRKSIEPMAKRAGVPPRTLQQFLSRSEWDDPRMADRLMQIVADEHSHPRSIGIADETGHPKKGAETAGVKRQYCGATGKVDNCVVTVHVSYVAGDFHTLLPGELFLPANWSDDRQRCQAANIPEQMIHRPKWQIVLELRDQAVANGVRFEWFTGDEGYGAVPAFHFGLDDRGGRYVLEVPTIFHGWLKQPALLQKQHRARCRPGRQPRYPRLKVKNLPTIEVRNMLKYCQEFRSQPWVKFYVKDTTKGPEVWQVKSARIYLKRDGLPTRPHWLIVARNVLQPATIKYFVSNAPAGTPLEVMLHVAFTRYRVEQCFEVEKGELGLDHFEVRNYRSLKRHLILTAVSHLFLAKTHEKWRGGKSGPDHLPGSPGRRGVGPLLVADRPGANELLAEGSGDHYRHAAGQQKVPTQPRERTQAAVA